MKFWQNMKARFFAAIAEHVEELLLDSKGFAKSVAEVVIEDPYYERNLCQTIDDSIDDWQRNNTIRVDADHVEDLDARIESHVEDMLSDGQWDKHLKTAILEMLEHDEKFLELMESTIAKIRAKAAEAENTI